MKQEMMGWQIICTSLQTDNHASTSSLNFLQAGMLLPTSNQQCQSTEGKFWCWKNSENQSAFGNIKM